MTKPSARSDAILDLGRQLVGQLGLIESNDVLARWMAHALAERIVKAETAVGAERAALQAEAIDLILKLWGRRRDFPRGARPFEEVEAIATALARLNPDDTAQRFYAPTAPMEVSGAPPKAKVWLDRALRIDSGARTAIEYCLASAADADPGNAEKWAELAGAAGLERDVEIEIVRFLIILGEREETDPIGSLSASEKGVQAKAVGLRRDATAIEMALKRKAQLLAQAPATAESDGLETAVTGSDDDNEEA